MSSPDLASLSARKLSDLFKLQFDAYRDIYKQLPNIYRSNPSLFADIFFDMLPKIDPKIVRVICYQLFTEGITMDQVYKHRTINKQPEFLSALNTFPLETLMTILKYRFPAYHDGDIFFLSSLPHYSIVMETPVVTNLDWLDFILNICTHLHIDLNLNNNSTQETCLIWAIKYGSLSLTQTLLYHRLDPNHKSIKGQSPLSVAIELLTFPDAVGNYPIYLNMIRHLRRYGALTDDVIDYQIKRSQYADQINQNLYTGKK